MNNVVAITGHRVIKHDELKVISIISKYLGDLKPDLVVHGGAIGFDTLVAKVCKIMKIPTNVYLPDYNKYGKRAPIVRNSDIVANANVLLCYINDDLSKSGSSYTRSIFKGDLIINIFNEL